MYLLEWLVTTFGVVYLGLLHHCDGPLGGDQEEGGHGEDRGTFESGDKTRQVPHFAQFDPHPNQDYPSFASYLDPFSCHQALVASPDLLGIP